MMSENHQALEPIRPLEGRTCASVACCPKEAEARVACGWIPVGALGESIVLVGDARAVLEYATTGGYDVEEIDNKAARPEPKAKAKSKAKAQT